jgi:hypothetical protein
LGGAVFDAGFGGRVAFTCCCAAPIRRSAFPGNAEGGDYGLLEGAAALQGFEDGELFPFEAAKIDGIVYAMNGQVDRSRLESRDCGNFFALLALFHGVAGDFGRRVAANSEEKIVDGVVEIEKVNVGLKAEAKFGGIGSYENRRGDGRFGGAVEGFDFGPFEANHI